MEFPSIGLTPSQFPPLLREIPDSPKQLYVRGILPPPDYTYLCIVGSRRTTRYGQDILSSLVAGLSKYPIAIVSGMAWGTDALAHQAALKHNLPTIAVLPSGLSDTAIYPAMNRPLARQILEHGGALVSENPHNFKPMLHSFAQRNRIVAGLCRAVLIIEAGEKSGTLITARLALEYNREVLVVPHQLDHENGKGCNTLIRAGATLIRNSSDILESLGFKAEEATHSTTHDFTPTERTVYDVLTEPMHRDDLVEITGLSAQDASIALSSLLIRGLVTERYGTIQRV